MSNSPTSKQIATTNSKFTAVEQAKMSAQMLVFTALLIVIQTNHDNYVDLFNSGLTLIGGPLGPTLIKYIGGAGIFNILTFLSGLFTAQNSGQKLETIRANKKFDEFQSSSFVEVLCTSAKYVGYTAVATSLVLPILSYVKHHLGLF